MTASAPHADRYPSRSAARAGPTVALEGAGQPTSRLRARPRRAAKNKPTVYLTQCSAQDLTPGLGRGAQAVVGERRQQLGVDDCDVGPVLEQGPAACRVRPRP